MKIKGLIAVLFISMMLAGCKNVPEQDLQSTTDMMEMGSSIMDDATESETESTTQRSQTEDDGTSTTMQVETNSATATNIERMTENNQNGATGGRISADRAEEIALTHAGVSKDQAQRLRSELKLDDGRNEYEVEFYANGTEYDYEIDAVSGKVLDFDKDRD